VRLLARRRGCICCRASNQSAPARPQTSRGRKESGKISFGDSDIKGLLLYALALLALAAFVYFVIVKAIVDDGNEQGAKAQEISERSQRSMQHQVEMAMKRSARMREQQRERADAGAATP
jgi:hypothetical protein